MPLSPRNRLAPFISMMLLAFAGAICAPAVASASSFEHRSQVLEFLAFSGDSKSYLMKVTDKQTGLSLQVRETKTNKLVKAYPYVESDEKRKLKSIARKHDITQPPSDDGTNPKKPEISMLLGQRGETLNVYMMKGEQIKKYTSIELLKDEKSGDTAKANMKQAVWNQKGKYVVIIYHQKLPGKFNFEGDFVHSFKFKSYKVKFDDDHGK